MGSTDPNTPIANGWLRVSHRALDPTKSTPYRPYHPHDRVQPLTPGEVYEADVEIVSSCIVVPKGWRLALSVRGKDYEYTGELSDFGKAWGSAELKALPDHAQVILRDMSKVENGDQYSELYNFISTFSGTHFVTPRSMTAELGFHF
jgi:predicted acyl esterase